MSDAGGPMFIWTIFMFITFILSACEETFLTGFWAPKSFKYCSIIYLLGMGIIYLIWGI